MVKQNNSCYPTVKDVASEANVSVSTVGRALNNDPRISVKTQEAVKKVAKKLGYIQSSAARIIRGGPSKLIGLIIPDLDNIFYASIAQAISRECIVRGYYLALSITEDNSEIEERQIEEFTAAKVSGIFIVPSAHLSDYSASLLSRTPYIQLLRNHNNLASDWHGIDDAQCIFDATSYLAGLGHKKVAYIGPSLDLSTGRNRLEGYTKALEDFGIPYSSTFVKTGDPSFDFAKSNLIEMLKLDSPPSGIICGGTSISKGILDTALSLGVNIPEDLSIISFGDPFWSKYCHPPVTSIKLPIEELATSSSLWFLKRISDSNKKAENINIITNGSLIVRGSTAPPKS